MKCTTTSNLSSSCHRHLPRFPDLRCFFYTSRIPFNSDCVHRLRTLWLSCWPRLWSLWWLFDLPWPSLLSVSSFLSFNHLMKHSAMSSLTLRHLSDVILSIPMISLIFLLFFNLNWSSHMYWGTLYWNFRFRLLLAMTFSVFDKTLMILWALHLFASGFFWKVFILISRKSLSFSIKFYSGVLSALSNRIVLVPATTPLIYIVHYKFQMLSYYLMLAEQI